MKTNAKERIKKYGKSLTSAPYIEEKKYYVSDNKKNLHEVDALNVRHEGITFATTKDLLVKNIEKNNDLLNVIKDTRNRLYSIFEELGYVCTDTELKSIIEHIFNLKLIKPNVEYTNFTLNSNYYVTGKSDVGIILEKNEIPDDFANGYWQIIDGVWKLDQDKYNEYWSVL